MVNEEAFLDEVSKTNADIDRFIEPAVDDASFQVVLVKHLVSNPKINVYYHSYLILSEASQRCPSHFYGYWDEFAKLLEHKNSYHRNYAMVLIANLIKVDSKARFDSICVNYYKQLEDEKVSTRKYCICDSYRILRARPDLENDVLSNIIVSLKNSKAKETHKNLLISEFVNLLISIGFDLSKNRATTEYLISVKDIITSLKTKRNIDALLDGIGPNQKNRVG